MAYDGKYLNGAKNGEGKEYNEFGLIIYERKYKNDKRLEGKYYSGGYPRRRERHRYEQKIIKDKMDNKLKK